VKLKFTFAQGTGVVDMTAPAAGWLAGKLVEALALLDDEPRTLEMRGPGRYVGSGDLDEVQAMGAIEQTLGMIERAGLRVLYNEPEGEVYLDMGNLSVERKK
ncbi:hypothetical protein LCGC14_2238050, partial [marine sediment metagenome]